MQQRFEYDFVRVALKSGFFTGRFASQAYQDEIQRRARNGWRLVDVFSPAVAGYGRSIYADLIFERPV